MKAKTKIPELDAILEQNQQRRWTPEIDRVMMDYYLQFAHDRDLKSLAAYINEKYDRSFTATDLIGHYNHVTKNNA